MAPKGRLDVLLLSQDLAVREALATELRARFPNSVVKAFSVVADAVNSHRIAWFDLIVVQGIQFSDCDCWRFLSMVRSGDFGFRDTPAFVLLTHELADAFAPLCDLHTSLVAAGSSEDAIGQIAALLGSVRLPTVLLVEDELRAATATARGLRKHFDVEICHDGLSALETWREKLHQLIVLDLMLPGMRGDEVLKTVISERPQQAVVILTAHNNPERHIELVFAGARTCISKPIAPHSFANICARVLAQDYSIRAASCADVAASTVERLSDCVHAAQHTLSSGRTAEAMRYLRHATAVAPKKECDDSWDSQKP